MSLANVKEYLKKYGIDNKILEFECSSATVELAARAVNCDEKQIAKTMAFIQKEGPVLIVAAGDARIDNRKYKDTFEGQKAKMIPPTDLEELVGHTIGGVCPFAIKDGVIVYLDNSLKRFETVYPACGSSNSAIPLTLKELENLSKYTDWIDVCKDWA